MTGLLVSVRNPQEAESALCGGADIIDVKEPRHGSLGAASTRVWDDIRRDVGPRCRLSVALGEITDDRAMRRATQVAGFQFAKLGLAGAADLKDWRARWSSVREQLSPDVSLVTVLYADWQAANTPHAAQILSWGAALGSSVVLIDTWRKDRGDLFSSLSDQELNCIIEMVRAQNQQLVLAGSLSEQSLSVALNLHPDYIAVRGAACVGGRNGQICAERVRGLSRRVRANCAAPRIGA